MNDITHLTNVSDEKQKNTGRDSSSDEPSAKRCQIQDPRVQKLKANFVTSVVPLSDEMEDILKINSRLHTNHFALVVAADDKDWTYINRCLAAAVKSMNYKQDKCLEIHDPSDWNTLQLDDTDLVVFRNPFGSKSYDGQRAFAMITALVGLQLSLDAGRNVGPKHVTSVVIVTCKAYLKECKKLFHHDLLNDPIFLTCLYGTNKGICASNDQSNDHVYGNLRDQSRCYIEEYRGEFRHQNIVTEAQTALQLRNRVVIAGRRRSGKTTLALNLLPQDKISNVLVLSEVDELKYIKFGDTFAVVIEDIGGKDSFDRTEALKWCRKFDMLYAAAKARRIKIIFTVDEDVLERWLETSHSHKILEHAIHVAGTAELEIDRVLDIEIKEETPSDEDFIAESMETVSRGPSNAESKEAVSRGPSNAESKEAVSRGPSIADSTEAVSRGPSIAESKEAVSRGPSNAESTEAVSRGPSNAESTEAVSRGPSNAESTEADSRGPSISRGHSDSGVKAVLYGTFEATFSTDRTLCDVWDICQLFNGQYAMTDFSNQCIKKMDQSYKITESLNLPGKPIGVCQVDKANIAVALWDKKKIQFVCNNERMTLSEKSIDVGGSCSGIACNDDLLYVSCGGKGRSGSKSNPGHVKVFDFFGILIAKYDKDFSCPEYLYFETASSKLYITDAYNGLITEEQKGVFQRRSYDILESPAGMCSISSDKLCIAGYSSNNVVLVNGHAEELFQLEKPAGLSFDNGRSRLIVTMAESNVVKVYDVLFE